MNAANALPVISTEEALATFRERLTGAHALELLRQALGRLLILLPVGVGKTELLLKIIIHAFTVDEEHDLVIVLVPRWDVLRELLDRLPPDLPRVVLTPRPRKRCGSLDHEWLDYEQHGCSLLGREQLCGRCPRRKRCRWPGQFGSRLRGTQLILATQAHLVVNPQFVAHLQHHTRARNPLVLLDESNFLVRPLDRAIESQDLEHFIDVQETMLTQGTRPSAQARMWEDRCQLLSQALTSDLREGWWQFPPIDGEWATEVQRRGRELSGPTFRFLGFDLHSFARSDRASRERLSNGNIRYAIPPYLGEKFIIFSGSIARELARYRLDPDHVRPTLVSPFADYRFQHAATKWFNLNSLIGTAGFFPHNAPQILDFFAHKIACNIRAGKRTLLIARKKFRSLCRDYLRKRLNEMGVGPVRIVTGDWDKHNLQDPRTLPLITYGVVGLNRFEHLEAAYCLTSFYTNPVAVTESVHDLDASTEQYPITIHFVGRPRRREARINLPDSRETILPRIAQEVLNQKEADVIVQAVGRVRPFTRPREIITFHASDLPGVDYTLQFESLEQARNYFGIPTAREAGLASRIETALRLQALGRTQEQIAQEMDVSLSSVKRYLRRGRGQQPFIYI